MELLEVKFTRLCSNTRSGTLIWLNLLFGHPPLQYQTPHADHSGAVPLCKTLRWVIPGLLDMTQVSVLV